MRRALVASMLTIAGMGPSPACQPMMNPPSLADADVRGIAAELTERSAVIVDGTIEWTPAGWKARSTGRGRDRVARLDIFPVLRSDRILRGAPQAAYRVIDTDYCGGGTNVVYLPPRTKVRLLLEPVGQVDGTELWSVISTSWDGTRANERRIDAAIDGLLAIPRDPGAASLVAELPSPPK